MKRSKVLFPRIFLQGAVVYGYVSPTLGFLPWHFPLTRQGSYLPPYHVPVIPYDQRIRHEIRIESAPCVNLRPRHFWMLPPDGDPS